MEEYKSCEVCGKPGELHHIIFRSQASYLTNVPVNFMHLCGEHHRTGKNAPHQNRKIDLQYKRILQGTIEGMLTKEYYTLEELKKLLNISKKEAERVVNKTMLYKEGYKREDLIKRLLGGRNYDISD